jgi:branched-chain amino acid aminotransferase
VIKLTDGRIGDLSARLYDTITGIQNGVVEDEFHWMVEVK